MNSAPKAFFHDAPKNWGLLLASNFFCASSRLASIRALCSGERFDAGRLELEFALGEVSSVFEDLFCGESLLTPASSALLLVPKVLKKLEIFFWVCIFQPNWSQTAKSNHWSKKSNDLWKEPSTILGHFSRHFSTNRNVVAWEAWNKEKKSSPPYWVVRCEFLTCSGLKVQECHYFRHFQRYLDPPLYRFVFAVTQRNFPDH